MGWFETGNKTKSVTREIPKVEIKERLKKVEISGHSRMADAGDFYEPLQKKLEHCFYLFHQTLIIDFRYEYINTGSSKWLYHILKNLQSIVKKGGLIEINWYYEEDDEVIQGLGEDMQSLIDVPFSISMIEE